MKVIGFILWLVFSLCCIGCNNKEYIKEQIVAMQQHSVNINVSEMELLSVDEDKNGLINCINSSQLKLIAYVDSASCSSCLIKNMYHWNDFLEESAHRYHGRLSTIFIFSSESSQLGQLRYVYRNSAFRHPIFIDTVNVFTRNNPQIPSEALFHSFLLDDNNNVLLVGNPITNPKFKDMIFEIADKETAPNIIPH